MTEPAEARPMLQSCTERMVGSGSESLRFCAGLVLACSLLHVGCAVAVQALCWHGYAGCALSALEGCLVVLTSPSTFCKPTRAVLPVIVIMLTQD